MRKTHVLVSIALILLLASSAIMAVMPSVDAQIPSRKTTAYISVAPKTAGVGQALTVNLWIYPSPATRYYNWQDQGFSGITVTFTRPDGSEDTFMPVDGSGGLAAGETEMIGAIWFNYKPNQAGTWSAKFTCPQTMFGSGDEAIYYDACTSQSVTFTVQNDPVNAGLLNGWPWAALPTGYWEFPINAENREWYQISGGWLQVGYDASASGYNAYSKAPNSAHVVWTREVGRGGLIGGPWGSFSFEERSQGNSPFVMQGKLFVNQANSMFQCIDLRTGELVYEASGAITLAQDLRQTTRDATRNTPETQGASVIPYLWQLSSYSWTQYNPYNGAVIATLTKVPGSMTTRWSEGDPVVYCIRQAGWNTTLPYRLATNELIKWDYTKVTGNNWLTGIVWNVSLKMPDGSGPGEGNRGSSLLIFDNVGVVSTTGQDDFYAYDLNTGARLWNKVISYPNMNSAYNWGSNGVWFTYDSASRVWQGYDIKTGDLKWTSDVIGEYPWGSNAGSRSHDDTNLYIGSYDGHVYAIDINTGKLNWKSDYSGDSSDTVFNTLPFHYSNPPIADGKIYWATGEHSPTQPRWRGSTLFCIDTATGKFLWNISNPIGTGYGGRGIVAEGYYIGTSEYDGLMYCIGKGQTAVEVSAPQTAVPKGTPILIQGTVTDQSPSQAGTPCVADECMSAWMEYLLMQKPMPTDVKGVPITVTAQKEDGTIINIGTTTTDLDGFRITWTPPTDGVYKIKVSFAGDESYWDSSATTNVLVSSSGAASPAPSSPQTAMSTAVSPSSNATDVTVYIGIAAVVIIAVVAAAAFAIRRHK